MVNIVRTDFAAVYHGNTLSSALKIGLPVKKQTAKTSKTSKKQKIFEVLKVLAVQEKSIVGSLQSQKLE